MAVRDPDQAVVHPDARAVIRINAVCVPGAFVVHDLSAHNFHQRVGAVEIDHTVFRAVNHAVFGDIGAVSDDLCIP